MAAWVPEDWNATRGYRRPVLITAALVAIVMLVGLGLLAFGLFMAAMALGTLTRDVRVWIEAWRSKGWQTTSGTITRSLVTEGRRGRRATFSPGIAYAYTVAGQHCSSTRQQFASWWSGFAGTLDEAKEVMARFPKGSPVTVFFDPANPESATLDRRRPSLGAALFFVVLLLLGAVGAIPAGVYVVIGAVETPPPFAAGDLPPLRHQLGGLLVILGAIALPVAGIFRLCARRNRGVFSRVEAATPTRIAAVRKGKDVAVFGRAEASDAMTVASPVTRDPVVYYRTRVLVSGTTLSEAEGRCNFYIRDESGRLLISTDGGTDQVLATSLPIDAAVQEWVDASFEETPVPVPELFTVELAQVAPGEPVPGDRPCVTRRRERRTVPPGRAG